MKPSLSHILSCCLLISLLCGAGPLSAAEPGNAAVKPAAGNRVTMDFREIELTDLIQTMSELTGRNFLYDETVRGKVTIVSPEGMTLDEAYQLFQTVLNVKGFTLVTTGKINKIVPVKGAKELNLPIVTDQLLGTDQYITRLIRLENLDAATIAETVLAPLVPSTANVVAYSPTNTLIITDSAGNIDRLAKIIQELDQPGSAKALQVIPLQYAGAEEVAKICNEMLAQSGGAMRRARGDATAADAGSNKILPYARTNSLIVMASPDSLATIRELVAQMDRTISGERSRINVYQLENADAETLAKTLTEILSGIKAEAKTASSPGRSPLSSEPVTITADKPTNALIINARPEDYDILRGIIQRLDVKRKQVYVEALIMELSLDATQDLGVSLQGAAAVDDDGLVFGSSNLNRGPVGFTDLTPGTSGLPSLLTKAVDGLLAGGFFNPITVTGPDGTEITVPTLSVLINLSKTDGDVNILSAPRLLTSDNEEAEIIVGSNVPIITSRLTDTGASDGLAQSVSVERKDVALILRFTPQVTEGDLVRLNVYQEMTDIVPASAGLVASVGSPNEVGPTFTKRVLRNTVLAANGKTVVLGGLIGNTISETVTKVPWLGDIPFLGWLFKTTSTEQKKTNLLIFINPTIIRGPEDLARVTNRNRQVADGVMTEKTRPALPQGYFDDAALPPAPPVEALALPPAVPSIPPVPPAAAPAMPAPAPDQAPPGKTVAPAPNAPAETWSTPRPLREGVN